MNNMPLVCVCMAEANEHAPATPAESKTARRRRVCSFTHELYDFLSLLLSCSSSSVSKRLVILHAVTAWLYDGELDNDPVGVAVDE